MLIELNNKKERDMKKEVLINLESPKLSEVIDFICYEDFSAPQQEFLTKNVSYTGIDVRSKESMLKLLNMIIKNEKILGLVYVYSVSGKTDFIIGDDLTELILLLLVELIYR